jgi:hypothetical protein
VAVLSVILTFGLCFLGAIPIALLWRSRVARVVALGVASFGLLVLAFQVLGCLAAVTGAALVTRGGALIASGVLCAVAWGVRRARRPRPELPTRWPPLEDRTRAWLALGVIVVGAFLAFAAASGLSAPPRGWDILSYHLPRAMSWLLHGDLGPRGSTGAFYPGNAELPILTLLFSGSDRLVPVVQLPFALLAGVALFGLARAIGASIRSSALAALVLTLSPIVFFQSTIAKDDVVVTALVLAGAMFLLRSLRARAGARERTQEIAAAGFALGLALGTKYSILPYVFGSAPLVLLVHYVRARGGPGAPRAQRAWRPAAVFVVAAAIPSLFWFARNAIHTGNPIEPLPLGPGQWGAWESPGFELQFVPRPSLWWIFPWIDRQLVAGYNGAAGYGAAFGALFLPGLILCARAIRSRVRHYERATLLIAMALGVAGWWFGKFHLPRLLLPVVALACAPIALVFDAVTRGARRALIVLLAVALAFSAAETLRITFLGRDITWTHRGRVDHREFYRMPDLIYELPAGTRILLLEPSSDDLYKTYRYPLVGALPGNDVVMEDDVGVGMDLAARGAVLGHIDLHAHAIDYVFMRIQTHRPRETWFDAYPHLYEKVVDLVEPGYPWYREAYSVDADGEIVGRALVATQMYRVLPRPTGIGWEGAPSEPPRP